MSEKDKPLIVLSEVLPESRQLRVSFTAHEPGDSEDDGIDLERAARRDEADAQGTSVSSAYMVLEMLPWLKGKTWNNTSWGVVQGLRPSSVRVTTGEIKCDARYWRVTVYLEEDEVTIRKVTQEVVVKTHGINHGHNVQLFLEGKRVLRGGEGSAIINVAAVRKLELSSEEK